MTRLADKVDNALNETRMLILGAQVLLGFQFQAVFQPGFERLPAPAQSVVGPTAGLLAAVLATGFALISGYVLEWVWRASFS